LINSLAIDAPERKYFWSLHQLHPVSSHSIWKVIQYKFQGWWVYRGFFIYQLPWTLHFPHLYANGSFKEFLPLLVNTYRL